MASWAQPQHLTHDDPPGPRADPANRRPPQLQSTRRPRPAWTEDGGGGGGGGHHPRPQQPGQQQYHGQPSQSSQLQSHQYRHQQPRTQAPAPAPQGFVPVTPSPRHQQHGGGHVVYRQQQQSLQQRQGRQGQDSDAEHQQRERAMAEYAAYVEQQAQREAHRHYHLNQTNRNQMIQQEQHQQMSLHQQQSQQRYQHLQDPTHYAAQQQQQQQQPQQPQQPQHYPPDGQQTQYANQQVIQQQQQQDPSLYGTDYNSRSQHAGLRSKDNTPRRAGGKAGAQQQQQAQAALAAPPKGLPRPQHQASAFDSLALRDRYNAHLTKARNREFVFGGVGNVGTASPSTALHHHRHPQQMHQQGEQLGEQLPQGQSYQHGDYYEPDIPANPSDENDWGGWKHPSSPFGDGGRQQYPQQYQQQRYLERQQQQNPGAGFVPVVTPVNERVKQFDKTVYPDPELVLTDDDPSVDGTSTIDGKSVLSVQRAVEMMSLPPEQRPASRNGGDDDNSNLSQARQLARRFEQQPQTASSQETTISQIKAELEGERKVPTLPRRTPPNPIKILPEGDDGDEKNKEAFDVWTEKEKTLKEEQLRQQRAQFDERRKKNSGQARGSRDPPGIAPRKKSRQERYSRMQAYNKVMRSRAAANNDGHGNSAAAVGTPTSNTDSTNTRTTATTTTASSGAIIRDGKEAGRYEERTTSHVTRTETTYQPHSSHDVPSPPVQGVEHTQTAAAPLNDARRHQQSERRDRREGSQRTGSNEETKHRAPSPPPSPRDGCSGGKVQFRSKFFHAAAVASAAHTQNSEERTAITTPAGRAAPTPPEGRVASTLSPSRDITSRAAQSVLKKTSSWENNKKGASSPPPSSGQHHVKFQGSGNDPPYDDNAQPPCSPKDSPGPHYRDIRRTASQSTASVSERSSVAKLVAKLNAISRDDPAAALANIDAILRNESRSVDSRSRGGGETEQGIQPVEVNDSHRLEQSGAQVQEQNYPNEPKPCQQWQQNTIRGLSSNEGPPPVRERTDKEDEDELKSFLTASDEEDEDGSLASTVSSITNPTYHSNGRKMHLAGKPTPPPLQKYNSGGVMVQQQYQHQQQQPHNSAPSLPHDQVKPMAMASPSLMPPPKINRHLSREGDQVDYTSHDHLVVPNVCSSDSTHQHGNNLHSTGGSLVSAKVSAPPQNIEDMRSMGNLIEIKEEEDGTATRSSEGNSYRSLSHSHGHGTMRITARESGMGMQVDTSPPNPDVSFSMPTSPASPDGSRTSPIARLRKEKEKKQNEAEAGIQWKQRRVQETEDMAQRRPGHSPHRGREEMRNQSFEHQRRPRSETRRDNGKVVRREVSASPTNFSRRAASSSPPRIPKWQESKKNSESGSSSREKRQQTSPARSYEDPYVKDQTQVIADAFAGIDISFSGAEEQDPFAAVDSSVNKTGELLEDENSLHQQNSEESEDVLPPLWNRSTLYYGREESANAKKSEETEKAPGMLHLRSVSKTPKALYEMKARFGAGAQANNQADIFPVVPSKKPPPMKTAYEMDPIVKEFEDSVRSKPKPKPRKGLMKNMHLAKKFSRLVKAYNEDSD